MLGPRLARLCLCLPLVLACSSSAHHDTPYETKLGAPPRPAPAERPIIVEPGPGVRDDGEIVFAVQWFDGTLDEALSLAEDQGKLVFVDVGAYWCPPCHELDEKVFTDPTVAAWLREHAIALHVDAEKGEGPELVERYAVQAYPSLLLIEPSGLEKGRIVDFHASAELIAMLAAIAEGGNVLAELAAAVEAAPDDLDARYALGHAYALAAKRELAEAEFERVLAGDPDNAEGLASKVLSDRATFFSFKLDHDPDAAIAAFEALQARFPTSKEAVSAYRAIGRAHCKQGRVDQAIAALEAMVASDPSDADLKASFGWFSFREKCRPEAGLAAVLAGIAQAPEHADLRYMEAELQRMLDEPDLALAAIREAARIEPDSAYFKRQVRRFEAIARGEPDPFAPSEAAPSEAAPSEAAPATH
ncbi:tetratricopeptide repeat protein [Nannocystaceae bacterium ST9]